VVKLIPMFLSFTIPPFSRVEALRGNKKTATNYTQQSVSGARFIYVSFVG
jgi:hypothetical protein